MGHFSSVIHNRIIQDIEILLINTNIYDGSWVNKGELFINTLVKKTDYNPILIRNAATYQPIQPWCWLSLTNFWMVKHGYSKLLQINDSHKGGKLGAFTS